MVIFLVSCATVPPAIDESFLIEKTPEQIATLEKIENSIIQKNKEVDAEYKNLDLSKKEVIKEKSMLAVIEKELSLANEKLKMATALTDENAIANAQKEEQSVQNKIVKQEIKLRYTQAKETMDECKKNEKVAELNVYVANLNYEKAKIAKAYQTKKLAENGKPKETKSEKSFLDKFTKDDNGIINENDYLDFVKSQEDKLENCRKDLANSITYFDNEKSIYEASINQ